MLTKTHRARQLLSYSLRVLSSNITPTDGQNYNSSVAPPKKVWANNQTSAYKPDPKVNLIIRQSSPSELKNAELK